jgi:transposase
MEVGIFDLEVREKRNQAFLNKARTGAKGGSRSRKGLRTPFDSMSAAEKRKMNGRVETVMYETIIPVAEFRLKDNDMQKLMLSRWREIYSNEDIRKQMKVSNKVYYDLVETLNLPKKPRGKHAPRQSKPKTIAIIENQQAPETQTMLELEVQEEPKTKLITNGFHLEYHGDYTADQLSKIFTKLQLLVEGEENKFSLSISITERT